MNKNVVLNAVSAYTANKNKINLNNYHCDISDDNIISGGYDAFYGSHYFKSNVVFPLAEAESWEIQFDYQYNYTSAQAQPYIFGSSSSNIYDCPNFYISSSQNPIKFHYCLPYTDHTWRYDFNTTLTPTEGQWYRFKIGKTNDFTYYIDYKLKTNDVWDAEFTRLWSDQPMTVNKNIYCVKAMMFLNTQPDLNRYTTSKIDLETLKVYINNDLYWASYSEFAIDELVYLNKGFAQVGQDVEANHLLDYLHGNCTEIGKVTAVDTDTVTVTFKSEGQSSESTHENNSDVIVSHTSSPNTKNNSDVVLTVAQDSATISTYGTFETASVNIVATQDDADIRCTTMLDAKPVDFTSSRWSANTTLPYYGYEIITQPVPPNYTSYIHYGGQDYSASDFPVLCKVKDWVTTWIKDPSNNIISYKNYEMSVSHLIYYQTVTVTSPIENTTIALKVNGTSVAGTSVYVWPGDIVQYTVSKTGYEDWVASYTVPVLTGISTQTLVVDILYPLPATYTIESVPTGAGIFLDTDNKVYSGFTNSNYIITVKTFPTTSSSYKFITKAKMVYGSNWNTLFSNYENDYDFGLTSGNVLYWDVYGGGTSLGFTPVNGKVYWVALTRDNSTYNAYILEDTGAYNVTTLPEFRFWTLLKSASGDAGMFNNHRICMGNWRGQNYPWKGNLDLTNTRIWADGVLWFDGVTAKEGVDYINNGCTYTNTYSQDGDSITLPLESDVDWMVAKYGYKTQYGTKTVTQTETDTVNLELGDDSIHAYKTASSIVEGDKVKINDGMADNATQDWSAYIYNTDKVGPYTQDKLVVHTDGDVAYCAGKPGFTEHDVTVDSGEIYHAYTNVNDATDSVYTPEFTLEDGHTTFNLENITNYNCNYLGGGIYQGGNNTYLYTNFRFDTDNANSWEIHLCYTHNTNPNDWNTIVGQYQNDNSGFTLNVRSNGNLQVNLLAPNNSWLIADRSVNLTMEQGTTYYMIIGYDSSLSENQYYFKYSTTDFPTSSDAPSWTYTSTTKNRQNEVFAMLGCRMNPTGRYNTGKLDLSKCKFILDGVEVNCGYFEPATVLYDSSFDALNPQPTILNNSFIQPFLASNGTMGGDSFAVSASATFGSYYAWYPFASDANTTQGKTWAASGNTADYIMYNPTPIKIVSFNITNRNEGSSCRPIVSGTVYGSNDGSSYTLITSFTNNITSGNATWTLNVNSDTAYKYYKISGVSNNTGYIGIGKIKINAISSIYIDNNAFKYTPSNNLIKSITSDIVLVDNTTINDVTVTTPTQGYEDLTFHAYKPTSGDTYFITDDPVSMGKFNFANITNTGCISLGEGVYQGGSGRYLITNEIPAIQTADSWEIKLKTTYNGGSTYPALMGSSDSSFYHAPHVHFMNGVLKVWLSSNGSSWLVEGGATTCPATVGATYYIKVGFEADPNNTGKYQYYVWWSTVGWEDTGTKNIILNNTTAKQYCSARLVLLNIYGNNQSYTGAYYYNGTIDMSETSITVDGVETTFGYFTNPSTLYTYNSGADTFDALDPQPVFIKSASNIIINDTAYVRTPADDIDKRVYSDAVIMLSAPVTTANNSIILTDDAYRIVNVTAPSDKTAYIQSSGCGYQPVEFPILIKAGNTVGLCLKDASISDTPYAYWSWLATENLDLHYQQIVFNVNVSDPSIIFKINDAQVTGDKFYVYQGDSYTYTVKKEGYSTVTGSGSVKYGSADNKITTIDITLTEIESAALDVSNFNYTVDAENNVTLTEYIGEPTEVRLPDVGE